MSIEHQRDGHPHHYQQNSDFAQPWRLEQVQNRVRLVHFFLLLGFETAGLEKNRSNQKITKTSTHFKFRVGFLFHFGPINSLEFFQDSDGFVEFSLRHQPPETN